MRASPLLVQEVHMYLDDNFKKSVNKQTKIEREMNKNINITKVLALVAVAAFGTVGASAQQQSSSATASTTATIVAPIAIAKNVDLNFGNLNLNANGSPGAVVLSAASSAVRTPSGTMTLPATQGTVTAGKFTVTGAANYAYTVTLPSSPITLATDGGGATKELTVNTFTSAPETGSTYEIGGGGNQIIYVGATLNADGNEVPGVYSSTGNFTVTVHYN